MSEKKGNGYLRERGSYFWPEATYFLFSGVQGETDPPFYTEHSFLMLHKNINLLKIFPLLFLKDRMLYLAKMKF